MAVTENPGRSQQQRPQQQNGNQDEGKGKALELAQRGALTLIRSFESEWKAIAPKHIDPAAFVSLAAAYVRRDPYLTEAMLVNPASLILTLRECASLGHVPRKGEFALVPFRDRKAPGGWSIVGVEEWRGVVERMFRSGGVRAVHVAVGRENDAVLSFQKGRDLLPRHTYDEFAGRDERGALKAVWAWADLHGGPSDVAWLNRHDIARHRGMSKTATSDKGPEGGNFWGPAWPGEGPNTEPMWKKTALHVLEGLVPTSAAYRWEVAQAGAAVAGQYGSGMPDVDPAARTDWVDGDAADPPQQQAGGPVRVAAQQGQPQPAGNAARDAEQGWPETAQPGGRS